MHKVSPNPSVLNALFPPVLLSLALTLSCAESSTNPPPVNIAINPGLQINDAIVAGIHLSATTAMPGDPVQISVHVPGIVKPEVKLQGETIPSTDLSFQEAEEGWAAVTSIITPAVFGDLRFQVSGTAGDRTIRGFSVLNIVQELSCGGTMLPEAGQCVVSGQGHRLQSTGTVLVNVGPDDPDAPNARLMIHPRMLYRHNNVLVGCHTDSVGLIPVQEMQTVSNTPVRTGT